MRRALLAPVLVAAVALPGCGGDKQKRAPREQGRQGGSATLLLPTDVDYLDPGHTYYTVGYVIAYATQRPLYSLRPGSNVPVPDLAAGAPEISGDDMTITEKWRRGVKVGPPVDREVTAKDVKCALERFFTTNVGGQYTAYYADIQGAPTRPGRYRPIPGIQTPDDHTLVLRLARPSAPLVASALVMPATAPVPQDYARKYDAKQPSTYNAHVVATGPYMVKRYRPGRSIQLVRNPGWDAKTDDKPAFLDSILVRTNATDPEAAGRRGWRGAAGASWVAPAARRRRAGRAGRPAGGALPRPVGDAAARRLALVPAQHDR